MHNASVPEPAEVVAAFGARHVIAGLVLLDAHAALGTLLRARLQPDLRRVVCLVL